MQFCCTGGRHLFNFKRTLPMKKSSPIIIVAVSDNYYCMLLAAMIKSVELNHHTGENIIIYIIEDGITNNNKRKLINSVNPEIIQVEWINIQQAIPPHIQLPLDRSTYPLNIYAKLFIPYLIPKEISRAIFLDVDMILLNDISKLWEIDLQGKIIGAVQDHYIKYIEAWDGIKNYKELGFTNGKKYFNAGLLVIDVEKWRLFNIEQQVLTSIANNIKFANFPEQYGLNVALYDKWFEIDPLWNFFASYDHESPYNIHFIGRKPIYSSYINNKKFQQIFYEYLYKTAWADFKPRSTFNNKLRKAQNKILKIRLKNFWKLKFM